MGQATCLGRKIRRGLQSNTEISGGFGLNVTSGYLQRGGVDIATVNDLDDHANLSVLDAISSAGSGSIITSTERTKLDGIETGAQVNDHSHSNQSILDAITDAGRGYLITASETNNILANTVNRYSHAGAETASLNVSTDSGTGYMTAVTLNKTTVSVAQPAT